MSLCPCWCQIAGRHDWQLQRSKSWAGLSFSGLDAGWTLARTVAAGQQGVSLNSALRPAEIHWNECARFQTWYRSNSPAALQVYRLSRCCHCMCLCFQRFKICDWVAFSKSGCENFVFRRGLDLEDEQQAEGFQHSDGLQTFTESIHLWWTDLNMSLLWNREESAPQRQNGNWQTHPIAKT